MDLIFIDLDGTLMHHGIISDANKEAIKKVQKLGHKVFLNTGRSYGYLPKWVPNEVPFDGLCCGYTYLRIGDEIVYSFPMDPDDVCKNLDFCLEKGIRVQIEGINDSWLLYADDEHMSDKKALIEFRHSDKVKEIAKITFVGSDFPDGLPAFGLEKIVEPTYTEGRPIGFDKTTPMKRLESIYHVGPENFLAIGDSQNDADMLAYSGKKAVIHHAPKKLDVFNPYRSESEEEGVAEILRHFYNI